MLAIAFESEVGKSWQDKSVSGEVDLLLDQGNFRGVTASQI